VDRGVDPKFRIQWCWSVHVASVCCGLGRAASRAAKRAGREKIGRGDACGRCSQRFRMADLCKTGFVPRQLERLAALQRGERTLIGFPREAHGIGYLLLMSTYGTCCRAQAAARAIAKAAGVPHDL